LKAVVFDMDGVLVDTMEYHRKINKLISDELGCEYTDELHNSFKGKARRLVISRMIELAHKIVTEKEIEYYSNLKDKYFDDYISSIDAGIIKDGIIPFIDELKENGILIGVASGSSNAARILDKTGLMEYVDYVGDVNKIKQGKPYS
jgi:beta-phosphoglucomutase-like phosphatase (HAD superfamily)